MSTSPPMNAAPPSHAAMYPELVRIANGYGCPHIDPTVIAQNKHQGRHT